ncbi:alpha-glucosidase [Dellaglioa sp. L3N]
MKQNEWWKESVVYQIYPKSFKDSNKDGMGDLKGIIEKIPYLSKLGVNLVWLSPIYKSPMDDGGYDISDYYSIDPMFGTNEDMDELVKVAKNHGIKLLMDLVINHTSDEHEWFKEALKNPASKYRNYYIFKEGIEGNPPNNWRSYFGGSAWEKVPNEPNMYFLHAFSKKQPDLNWENSAVRNECIDMINWWLDKGFGGFRIDAILNLKKNMQYGQFEADGEDGLAFIGKWILNQPGIEDWLKEIDEKTFKKHNSFTIAEADVADELLPNFIGDTGVFRSTFDFSYTDIDTPETGEWYLLHDWTIDEFKKNLFHHQLVTQKIGWGAQYLENHDQPRSINKYLPESDRNDTTKKMLATLFMMLHGTPFIYQGQEIGMENIHMDSMDDYDDIATHEVYARALLAGQSEEEAFGAMYRRSRDNSRTPMQWNRNNNAGFSDADNTWLKVNPNYQKINVMDEGENLNSVLNFYKKLIELRRKESKYKEVIINGEFVLTDYTEENLIAYRRVLEVKELLVLINFDNHDLKIKVDEKFQNTLINNFKNINKDSNGDIILQPYQSVVLSSFS